MNVSFITSKRPCIACGSAGFARFYTNKYVAELISGPSLVFDQSLECCYECGLVRQEENKTYSAKNLSAYYKGIARTPVKPGAIAKNDKRSINARKRLDFIRKQKNKGTLLEIGFGDGVFLNEAAKHFTCTGLDPSKGYKYVNDYLASKGIKVYNTALENFDAKNKYDVVCCFLVLEHIQNPLAFLKQLKKHVKPGGLLVLEVPDIDRYKHFNSETMLTHEHVYHYTIKTLSHLLTVMDMKLVSYSNKNISYGFSLLAAFANGRPKSKTTLSGGFETLQVFEGFMDMRDSYRAKMQVALSDIVTKAQQRGQKLAVYGTGFLFKFAQEKCGLKTNDVDYLFDDTPEKAGTALDGKKILPLAEIAALNPGVVIVFSEMFFNLMKNNIEKHLPAGAADIVNIHQKSQE
ncbi:MAG TPA: class I SAM-dependent methyltransferase [Chitinophagales bacterium]|nr:class I SAM-dependent methyltransferase [Chitinophagales bacterium]